MTRAQRDDAQQTGDRVPPNLMTYRPPEPGPNEPQRQKPRLGRQYLPDPRDASYPLDGPAVRSLVRNLGDAKRKLPWHSGPGGALDQGDTSECVVHAFMHFIQGAPIVHDLQWTRARRTTVYRIVQQLDGWPLPHDGTTARAMLQWARAEGMVDSYFWAQDEGQVQEYLRSRGPLLGGMDWFSGMFTPVGKHFYLEPSGYVVGGHEMYLRWYFDKNHKTTPDTYLWGNSWGGQWTNEEGDCRMTGETFRYLLFQLNGDLAAPVEAKKKAA